MAFCSRSTAGLAEVQANGEGTGVRGEGSPQTGQRVKGGRGQIPESQPDIRAGRARSSGKW